MQPSDGVFETVWQKMEREQRERKLPMDVFYDRHPAVAAMVLVVVVTLLIYGIAWHQETIVRGVVIVLFASTLARLVQLIHRRSNGSGTS